MKAYFDTSVLVTLTLQEEQWPTLFAWIVATLPTPFFSDFGWGEFISALGRKVRMKELTAIEGAHNIAIISEYLGNWTRVRVPRRDFADAAEMVAEFHLGLRFPDAIHIAAARRNGCCLITADKKQFAAARHFGLEAINPYDP